jgi:hypothetical protein
MNEQEKIDQMEQIEIDIAKLKQEYRNIYNNSLVGLKSYKTQAIVNTVITVVAYLIFIFMTIIQDTMRMFFIMFSIGMLPFMSYIVISSWKRYWNMKKNIS